MTARLSAFAAICVVAALGGPCRSQPADPLQFTFDSGFHSTPGLEFRFSRPVPTVDFAGLPVEPDQARPERPTTLAGAPQPTLVRASTGAIPILGFGVDRDGVTPLLAVCQYSPGRVDVFTVTGDDLLAAEVTGIGRNRTKLGAGSDLLRGAYPGRRFRPSAGTVACGLIVALCEVSTVDQNGVWSVTGVGFVASQDQGKTWSLLYDDGPVQPGQKRVREWGMSNWWPMSQGPDPLEMWLTATDYRANPGATGGRAFILRATRARAGDAWNVESVNRIYEQIGPVGQHFHTAAVLPFGDQGLRAILSIGDGQSFNRIVSFTRGDRDYLSPDGWTIDEAYHGSKGTPGTQGNQYCGSAPFNGGSLIGSDLSNEQIMRLETGDADPHPTTSWVYGLGSANKGNDCANFVIRTPTPNLPGSPYVSWFQVGGKTLPGSTFARRILFSPDGERWMQAINPEAAVTPSVGMHGSDLYFSRTTAPIGLFRAPMPVCLTRVPLDIRPGGLQRLVAAPGLVPAKGGTITPLQRNEDGLWIDGGVPIDPQPPALGQVYRVHASVTAPITTIGTIRPTGAATDFGNIVGVDAVATRYWVRNLDPGKTARPRLTLRSSDKTGAVVEDVRVNVTDRWLPFTPTYLVPVIPGKQLEFVVLSGTPTPDNEDFYLALDSIIEGYGMAGYPLPLDTSQPAAGTAYPDETAAVSGFSSGPAWTITLAGQTPSDGFDGTITSVKRWPLAAAWADPNNYVQLIADTARRRLIAEIYRDGLLAGSIESTEIYWARGSAVLVSMADAGDGSGIQASFSVGGLPVRDAKPSPGRTTASLAASPVEIRFGDASGQSGNGVAVRQSPMQWWGGQIDVDVARPKPEREAMLTSLSFLSLPPGRPSCDADLDRDGELTMFDFLAFQDLFAAGDARADLDGTSGNGVLDVADFLEFMAEFQEGCR